MSTSSLCPSRESRGWRKPRSTNSVGVPRPWRFTHTNELWSMYLESRKTIAALPDARKREVCAGAARLVSDAWLDDNRFPTDLEPRLVEGRPQQIAAANEQ